MPPTYQLSGRLGNSLWAVPIFGSLAAFVCGYLYAYLDVYMPIAGVFTIFLVGGCGAGIGFATAAVLTYSKCRSRLVAVAAGLLIGLIGWYCAWAVFEHALLARFSKNPENVPSTFQLLIAPGAVWQIAERIAQVGWYTFKKITPSGGFLWTLWSIEGLLIVGVSTVCAVGGVSGVFCETAGEWAKEWKPLSLVPPADPTVQAQAVEGNLLALAHLEATDGTRSPQLQLKVFESPVEGGTSTWELALVTHSIDSEGKMTISTKDLTPRYIASPTDLVCLRALEARAAQFVPAPPPPAEPPPLPPAAN